MMLWTCVAPFSWKCISVYQALFLCADYLRSFHKPNEVRKSNYIAFTLYLIFDKNFYL